MSYELAPQEPLTTLEYKTERFRNVNRQIGAVLMTQPIDYYRLDQLRRQQDTLGAHLIELRLEEGVQIVGQPESTVSAPGLQDRLSV